MIDEWPEIPDPNDARLSRGAVLAEHEILAFADIAEHLRRDRGFARNLAILNEDDHSSAPRSRVRGLLTFWTRTLAATALVGVVAALAYTAYAHTGAAGVICGLLLLTAGPGLLIAALGIRPTCKQC